MTEDQIIDICNEMFEKVIEILEEYGLDGKEVERKVDDLSDMLQLKLEAERASEIVHH